MRWMEYSMILGTAISESRSNIINYSKASVLVGWSMRLASARRPFPMFSLLRRRECRNYEAVC